MSKSFYDVYNPLLPTLLISIHNEYVQEIKSGQKMIEYRKNFFKDSFQAFVYTTGKNGGIELFIKCDTPILSNATTLAKIGNCIQHNNFDEIYTYFKEKNTGVIIPIVEVYQCKKIELGQLKTVLSKFVVPQKYIFLDPPDKAKFLSFLLAQKYTENLTHDWTTLYRQVTRCMKNNISDSD